METKLSKTLLSRKPSERSILLALVSFVILLLIFWVDPKNWAANGHEVFHHRQYWKAWTSTLIHGDFDHLGSNAIFFTGLATLLNYYFGWGVFPILSFVVGGIINLITLKFYPEAVYLVGISGVIYFMAAFWMTLYLFVERKISLTRRLINVVGVALIFLFPQVFKQEVSYLAHGVGLALGIPAGGFYIALNYENIRSHEVWKEVEPVIDWEQLEREQELSDQV